MMDLLQLQGRVLQSSDFCTIHNIALLVTLCDESNTKHFELQYLGIPNRICTVRAVVGQSSAICHVCLGKSSVQIQVHNLVETAK